MLVLCCAQNKLNTENQMELKHIQDIVPLLLASIRAYI